MSTKSVSSATHVGQVNGTTRFTCSMTRSANPVVCGDGEVFASAVTTGGWDLSATIEGVDKINVQALEGDAAASLVVVHPASDGGGTAKTFTLIAAVPHGYSESTPEPGSPGSASINFNCSSADGTTIPISIA